MAVQVAWVSTSSATSRSTMLPMPAPTSRMRRGCCGVARGRAASRCCQTCQFSVQSPYLPILLDNHHLRPETIGLALAAGMAMRLMAAQAVARLADRLDAPKVILALCTTAAALIGLGYLPAQAAWLRSAVGVLHSAALAPLPPLSDTLALGAAAPAAGTRAWR